MRRIAFYFLFLLVFTIPWQGIVVIPGIGTFSRLIGFASLGVALLVIILYKRVSEFPLIIIFMVLFITWNLFTYLWSIHPPRTFSRIITYSQLLAMVWLIWELCRDKNDGLLIMQAYILGAYIAIVDMLLNYFTGQSDSFRIVATGFNPNWLAISFGIGIPVAWHLIFEFKNKILFIFNLLYLPLAMFCVILTASRGGLITTLFACSIIPLSFLQLGRNPKYVITMSLLFIFALIPILSTDTFLNLGQNIERLTSTPEMIHEGRMTGRENIWRAGYTVFSENALLGVGSGCFSMSVESVFGTARAAHNAYLSVLVDAGIIGFLLFLAIIIISLTPNFNLPYNDKIFFIILIAALLIGLIPANMEANKVTWFVFGILTTKSVYLIRNGKLVQVFK